MTGLRRALAALGVASLAFAGIAIALTLTSHHEHHRALTATLGPVIALGFVGTGLFAWLRRPANRFGALMTLVGFTYLLGALTEANDPTVFSVGLLLDGFYFAVIAHMIVAFPTGRLETALQRRIVGAAYALVALANISTVVTDNRDGMPKGSPDIKLAIWHDQDVGLVIDTVARLAGIVLTVWIVVMLVRRWQAATPPRRRATAPVLWTGTTLISSLALSFLLRLFELPDSVLNVPMVLVLLSVGLLPYAFLAGLVRSRYSRAGAVGELVERLNDAGPGGGLRDALADALGDRSLQLGFWLPGAQRYVTAEGHPFALPPEGSRTRAFTEVDRDGVHVAAIVHDAVLCDEPELVRAAGAAAALALENERLDAELRARVGELEVSRAKLIEVGMAERRRLERDLHDGAQQRLVALSLQLGLARARMSTDPAAGAEMLDAAREELGVALGELRELARGIHPAILTDRGLGPALEALAERAPLPVEVGEVPSERFSAPVEAAAYFVVAESLTNVARYAGARIAQVKIGRDDGFAVVEVRDDGVGGADPRDGSGLRGLADRLAALDGRLEVVSPPGEGTLVRAKLPCASS